GADPRLPLQLAELRLERVLRLQRVEVVRRQAVRIVLLLVPARDLLARSARGREARGRAAGGEEAGDPRFHRVHGAPERRSHPLGGAVEPLADRADRPLLPRGAPLGEPELVGREAGAAAAARHDAVAAVVEDVDEVEAEGGGHLLLVERGVLAALPAVAL